MGRTLLGHLPNRAEIEKKLALCLEVGVSETERTPTREIAFVAA